MKDSRFIELLNLYVDHQISADDAALLEAEIQRKPERRRVYREYCQMQKACAMLSENFRAQAPAGGKVLEFPRASRSRMNVATYAMGVLAAAACVALVLVERDRLNDNAAQQQAPTVAVVEQVPASPAVEIAPAAARPALQPAFAGLVRDDVPVNASLAANVPLDWMNGVQLQRVSTGEIWFESRPAAQPGELVFRSPRTNDPQASLAAFRFQR
ncbi:MAG TPA: hypothetical protein VEQ65_11345 [Opitutus sp.]|nr:hypothetical protein [Opitutus sp.]